MLRHRLLCITLAALAALSPAHGQEEKSSRSALEAFVAEQGKEAIEANHQMQRAVHVVERLPVAATWLAQLAFYRALSTPEARRGLDSLERLPDALDGVSTVVGALPELIERERTALLGEANETIAGLDRSLATVERLLGGEDADPFSAARDLGVTLIAVFFACALAAALAYRYLAARIAPAGA